MPLIDASGVTALQDLFDRCERQHVRVILSGLQPQPREVMRAMDLIQHPALLGIAPDFEAALAMAREATTPAVSA